MKKHPFALLFFTASVFATAPLQRAAERPDQELRCNLAAVALAHGRTHPDPATRNLRLLLFRRHGLGADPQQQARGVGPRGNSARLF